MLKNYRHKILLTLGGTLYVLALLMVLSIVLIPTASKLTFSYWLDQQHLQGGIDDVDLSLKTGTLTIQKAAIRKNKQTLLQLGKFQVRISLRDLLDHKLIIEQVILANTHIQIAQQNDVLDIAGIRLKQTSGTAPPAPAPASQDQNEPWTIQLNQLHIAALDTCLRTDKTSQPLHVCNHLGDLSWRGTVELSTRDPLGLKSTGTFSISNLNLQDETKKLSLLSLGSLAVTKVDIDSLNQIRLGTIELQQFSTLPNQEAKANNAATLSFDKLTVDKVALSQMNDLDIAAIRIEDIATFVRLKADNHVASLEELAGYRPSADDKHKADNRKAAKAATKTPVRIKVGDITVATTKPFVLEDAHTHPATIHRINNFSIQLGAIDSSKPDQSSSLAMQLKYGEYGDIKVTGKVQVFAARPTLDLNVDIKGLNLNRVSTYTREILQHKIESGQLDARLTIKIDQGKLDSDAKLTLNKFYVDKLSAKEADKYQKSLGIPLSAALSLLRDKNDAIDIDLPITGDVEKPDFSLNDVISTVSAKAIKVAIINYYATLGLVKIVSGAFNLLTALRFDPLEFMPGQPELTNTTRSALDKFATMLLHRPQVHLVVCGHATLADQLKLFPPKKPAPDTTTSTNDTKPVTMTQQQLQQLNNLALLRSEEVKKYLVEQKGIAADRLIECNPQYHANDEHTPYVTLHI